jgi:hypothetical protein
MGIVAFCPNGHRVKVKDELAGRKGICPTCAARFRIPRETPQAAPEQRGAPAAGVPLARIVSLDPLVVASLPTAVADEPADAWHDTPDFTPVDEDSSGVDRPAPLPAAPEPLPDQVAEHAALDERPDLAWCVAVRGGTPSAPLDTAAMRAWLESGVASADHVVWRQDWPDWRPLADVFSGVIPPEPPRWP